MNYILIDSIKHINYLYLNYINSKADLSDHDHLRTSINTVENQMILYNKNKPQLTQLKKSIQLIASKTLRYYNASELFEKHNFNCKSILMQISRQYDENVHSDFIASLFNYNELKQFSVKLFNKLIEFYDGHCPNIEPTFLNVYREIRLDEVDSRYQGADIAGRRIDLLIECKGHVIVIENKVLTSESENQTHDYYMVISNKYLKSRQYFLLLSPSGIDGRCTHFRGLNYFELCTFIEESMNECSLSDNNRHFINFYINELKNTIISNFLQNLANSYFALQGDK